MLKSKSVIKIISLILAIGLWAYVLGEVNPTVKKTIAEIPVQLTNVETLADSGLALSSDETYFTAIVVKGSRSELNSLKTDDIQATADVYGYKEGENHVSVDVVLPDGIYLEEIRIPEITVKLEKLTAGHLPVTVEFTGESSENMEPTYRSLSPANVEVKGAESVIAKVYSVRVQLDVSELSETWDVYSGTPVALTKDGKIIKNVTISTNSVEVEAVMHHVKTVPLKLKVTGAPDSRYGEADITIPKEVTVKGNSFALERVTSLSAESVDISDVTENTTVELSVDLPEGVELADGSENIGVNVEFK